MLDAITGSGGRSTRTGKYVVTPQLRDRELRKHVEGSSWSPYFPIPAPDPTGTFWQTVADPSHPGHQFLRLTQERRRDDASNFWNTWLRSLYIALQLPPDFFCIITTINHSYMQLYRTSTKLPRVFRSLKTPRPITITRNMALFPRFPQGDFAPLFRLLDDYDVHRSGRGGNGTSLSSSIRAFQPKFDVREVKDAYELQGELPGINQKDVAIEFVDPHTLVIKGRVEREHHEGSDSTQGRITEADQSSSYHKASVEEEGTSSESKQEGSGSDNKQVAQSDQQSGNQAKPRYWVTERSVGEFHRSFTFPTRVDQDNVKASMKNGILNIVVPKAAAPTTKRINIE